MTPTPGLTQETAKAPPVPTAFQRISPMGPVPTQRPPPGSREDKRPEAGYGGKGGEGGQRGSCGRGEGGAGLSDVSMSNANRETSWSTRLAAANREAGLWPRRPPTETNKDPGAGGAGEAPGPGGSGLTGVPRRCGGPGGAEVAVRRDGGGRRLVTGRTASRALVGAAAGLRVGLPWLLRSPAGLGVSAPAAAGLAAQIGTFKQLIVTSQRGPPASRQWRAER